MLPTLLIASVLICLPIFYLCVHFTIYSTLFYKTCPYYTKILGNRINVVLENKYNIITCGTSKQMKRRIIEFLLLT